MVCVRSLHPPHSLAVYLVVLDLAVGEAGVGVGAQPLVELRQRNLVEVDVELLLQLVQVLLLGLGCNITLCKH